MQALKILKKLLSLNTINPPGNEEQCAKYLGGLLEEIGFSTEYHEFAPKRTTLIASYPGKANKKYLVFTGHMDVVPLGKARWQRDPFAGEIDGGKIYGRGASDMKSGLAAMLAMAWSLSGFPEILKNIIFIFTAGEETCCQGASHICSQGLGPKEAGGIVVGEPTSNYPCIAHKGCVRFRISTKGRAAHASMIEQGDNAIHKAADAVKKLQSFDFKTGKHPLVGNPSLNIGTISGGTNINSVPDKAELGIDIRTIPGQDHAWIQNSLQEVLGREVQIELLEEAESVATSSDNEWVRQVYGIMEKVLNQPIKDSSIAYFTDGACLKSAFGDPPTIILGPGETDQAHKTDEFCYLERLEQAVQAYIEIARDWSDGK